MNSLASPEPFDVVLRLLVAALLGGLIGLNRELRGKPAGLRTHALVSLGSALLVVITLGSPEETHGSADAMSRVIQGVVTGIGFLGAGVIIQLSGGRVTGLTSAAMIWIAAALGIATGLGRWLEVGATALIVVLVLLLEVIERHFLPQTDEGTKEVSNGTTNTSGNGREGTHSVSGNEPGPRGAV